MDQVLPQIAYKAKAIQKAREAKSVPDPDSLFNPEVSSKNVIYRPLKDHKQTFILLHGKGDEAKFFGGGLLDARIPEYGHLRRAFPHAKFIFPQAPKRVCARHTGWIMFQWFDNWGYDKSSIGKEDLKVEGLRETTSMVHELITKEIETVGAKNIVIGGLSQGCAASLICFLTWQGEPLAGTFGMCGHLPFQQQIDAVSQTHDDTTGSSASKAVSWLRNKLDLPVSGPASTPFLQTPLFTAHGDEDTVVPTRLGREAAQCLEGLGAHSVYHEYKGLTHWYNDTMLHDFISYLKGNTEWEGAEDYKTDSS